MPRNSQYFLVSLSLLLFGLSLVSMCISAAHNHVHGMCWKLFSRCRKVSKLEITLDTLTDEKEMTENLGSSRKSTLAEVEMKLLDETKPRPLIHCRSVPEFDANFLPKKILKRQTTDIEKRFVQFKELSPVFEDNSNDF